MSTVGTRWYTIAEAAPVLGVSVDTVRRRLKRGEIEARQVHAQHGPTWEVCLGTVSTEHQEAAEGSAQGAQGSAEGDIGAGMVQLVALVDRLQQENRVLAGQVGFLTAQLSTAEERLALAAPQSPPEAPGSPHPVEPTSDTFSGRLRSLAPWLLLGVILLLALAVGQPSWLR